MVECPRCGFIQPDDRYCANCGLDSQNYIPKPVPLYLRIINNTGVQLTAALLIVASLIFGLYKNQQNHLELAINKAEEAQRQNAAAPLTTVSAKILPAKPTDTPKPSVEAKGSAEPAETQSLDLSAKERAKTEEAESTAQTLTTTTATIATADSESKTFPFTVSFVELSKEMLAGLAQVKPVKTWSQTKAWLITNFQGGQELSTFSQSLPAGHTWNMEIPNKERGLQISVTPLAGSTEAHLKVAVKTTFRWPTERPGESKSNELTLEGPFDIPSQNHLVITGFIRRIRNITLTEATLIQDTPLSIMTTENFQNQTSDLALTIQ